MTFLIRGYFFYWWLSKRKPTQYSNPLFYYFIFFNNTMVTNIWYLGLFIWCLKKFPSHPHPDTYFSDCQLEFYNCLALYIFFHIFPLTSRFSLRSSGTAISAISHVLFLQTCLLTSTVRLNFKDPDYFISFFLNAVSVLCSKNVLPLVKYLFSVQLAI